MGRVKELWQDEIDKVIQEYLTAKIKWSEASEKLAKLNVSADQVFELLGYR